MPRRSAPTPPQIEIKSLSPEDIERGINKFRKRIEEVRALDPYHVQYNDPKVHTVEHKISEAVRNIFGENSAEFKEYGHIIIWKGSHNMGSSKAERQRKFAEGIPYTISKLEGLVGILEERKEDLQGSPRAMAFENLRGLSLHPCLETACSDLYKNEHYPEAVFGASKALINYVKEKSARHDLDGIRLMTTVFSKSNPVLAFNDLSLQTDTDEQQGMMYLYMGAVLAIRNPRGHDFISDSPERALEYIALINFLVHRLDEAKKV